MHRVGLPRKSCSQSSTDVQNILHIDVCRGTFLVDVAPKLFGACSAFSKEELEPRKYHAS